MSDFEIVDLDTKTVTGLEIRTNNEIEASSKGKIAKAWEETRQVEDPNLPAAVYTDYSGNQDDDFSVVIGFINREPHDGERTVEVPAGKYAKFSKTGPIPDAVLAAWQDVWAAEKSGSLKRAYQADLEFYPNMGQAGVEFDKNALIELYISI
ncbi:MAG: GyrI-like domain-containing protein [Micrococcaceae bacterium]